MTEYKDTWPDTEDVGKTEKLVFSKKVSLGFLSSPRKSKSILAGWASQIECSDTIQLILDVLLWPFLEERWAESRAEKKSI